MISISNIEFSYARRNKRVFTNFSASMESGAIYGLLGKNGTGKSTLLYLLSGLLSPQKGEILIDDKKVSERRADMLQDIFLVPEEFDLPNISLEQYIKFNAPFYPNFSNETLENCLREFELPTDIHLGSLSMGQKKKVFMAFALATQTKILMMDEPTNGLDIPAKSQFRKVVSGIPADGRTLIISTHQVKDVEHILDQVIMIERDQLLYQGSTEEISDLEEFFIEQLNK